MASPKVPATPQPKSEANAVEWYQSNPFELIRPSLNAFKLGWKNYLWYALTFLGVLLVVGLLVAAAIFGYQKSPALGIVAGVLAVVAIAGLILYFPWSLTRLTIANARGEELALGESWPELSQAGKFLGTQILYGLIVVGGFILLVVPGVIFLAWFSMAQYVMVEEHIYGMAALRRSRELVRGRIWDIWGTLSLTTALSIVSVVPILGPLVSLVLAVVLVPLVAVRYVQLKKLKQLPEVPHIPVSRWNFAVIFLALAVNGLNDFSTLSSYNDPTLEKNL